MADFVLCGPRRQTPIDLVPFHQWQNPDGTLWVQFFRRDPGYLLRFPGLADFDVSQSGKDVVCHPDPRVTDDVPQHLYFNQVLPLSLSKQGFATFHASAVNYRGGAIAFIGMSGRGKSTLAASFAIDGHRVLTDDGLILQIDGESIDVLPGHPSIRLWCDSEEFLVGGTAEKAPALPFTDKARLLAGPLLEFCDQPSPLRSAFFLGEGNAGEANVRRLGAAEALIEWAKHSFLLDVQNKALLQQYFDHMTLLAKSVECYRLDYPRDYAELAKTRQIIAGHLDG